MRSRWIKTASALVAGVAALATCVGIPAQQQPQPPAAKAQSKEPETVQGRADILKSTWGDKTEVLMKGNVKFTSSDTVMTSDQVTYDKQTKTAASPGKIGITDPECDITGDKGNADFNKKLGVIEGNVTMLLKPKSTDQTPQDKDSIRAKMTQPTTITCPKLQYLYKDKIATATGGVSFKQAKRSASANKAVYDAKKELLTLTGDVNGVDEDGQTFSAPTVRISLKKGDEWMEAENASASFKVDLNEEQKPEQATGNRQ